MKTTPLPIDAPDLDVSEEPSARIAARPEGSIIAGLFRAQAGKMRRYLAFRLQNGEDAKDATQDVFLKLWRRERAGQLRKEALAYMYSASHTVAIDTERRRALRDRDRLPEADLDEIPGASHDAADRLYWRKALDRLVNGMEGLPALTRDVFRLHHFEGLDYPQIAKRLDVSLRTVERHIALGTRELRELMKEFL